MRESEPDAGVAERLSKSVVTAISSRMGWPASNIDAGAAQIHPSISVKLGHGTSWRHAKWGFRCGRVAAGPPPATSTALSMSEDIVLGETSEIELGAHWQESERSLRKFAPPLPLEHG